MVKKIDLHIHTTCSDGALTPKEVIDKAVLNNVEVIAIADHDTVDAYTKELFDYAKENNVKIINAVEISSKLNKHTVHVLGYNFDLNNQEFINKLNTLKNARHDYLYNVAKKLEELGYILNTDELDKIEAVTKAHIAFDVIENPKNEKILLDNFNHIPNKGEFIEAVMNYGCAAYVVKQTVTPKEAADIIRNAGGVVVLAHPVAYTYENNLSDNDILDIVNEIRPDGIESYYFYVDSKNNKINDIKKWNDFADTNNLFKTIGSDFHISDGLRPEIGCDIKELELSNNEVEEILNNFNL